MIVASFDKTQNRTAAVSGAYQYDTGQRLAMHGLPSPSEMAGEDDLLSGDLVTVQAQFSYVGDSQADMRLAMWDEERQLWLVDVPDDYLTRHRDVHVYVYLYYGADETSERAETAYEATFRPISRPAPSGKVTEDQIAQWNALKAEIEISMAKVESTIGNANSSANEALDAASDAIAAAQKAQEAQETADAAGEALRQVASRLDSMFRTLHDLPAGSEAEAQIDLSSSAAALEIGAPRGADGPKGEPGEIGPADIKLEYDAETKTLYITTRGEE